MYRRAHAGHVGSVLSCAAEILVISGSSRGCATETRSSSPRATRWRRLCPARRGEHHRIARELDFLLYGRDTLPCPSAGQHASRESRSPRAASGTGCRCRAGMALGAMLNRRDRRFFCLTSDGELDEGSTWEAALFIAHRKLTNAWYGSSIATGSKASARPRGGAGPRAARREARCVRVSRRRRRWPRFRLSGGGAAKHARAFWKTRESRSLIIADTIKGHGVRYMQRHRGVALSADGRRAIHASAARAVDRAREAVARTRNAG